MSFQELNKIHHFKSKSNDFVSEKENENTQKVSQNPNKHTWLYQQTFPGKEEADKWIDKQKIWSKNYSRETNAGRKQFYRCNLVPYRGQQCTAAVHLVFDAESLQVQQYYTAEEHNHDEIMVNRKTIGINNQTKQAINELLKLKIQVPKIIRNTLERQAETDPAIMVPSERQLNNYLQNQRGKKKLADHSSLLNPNQTSPNTSEQPNKRGHQRKRVVPESSSRLNAETEAKNWVRPGKKPKTEPFSSDFE